jgi:hypothetical protein
MAKNTKPELIVTLGNNKISFPLFYEKEAVSIGSDWIDGLAISDSEYNKLCSLVGDFADVPLYLFNEGNITSGYFCDDEPELGSWEIAI